MSRHRSSLLSALAGAVLATCAAAPDAPASYVGAGDDPAGDAADRVPAHDLTGLGLGYGRATGTLVGAVRLAAAPPDPFDDEHPASIQLFGGTRSATGCDGYPAVGFGALSGGREVGWQRLDAAGAAPAASGEGERSRNGAGDVQRFEATDRRLAGRRFDCVVAQLVDAADTTVVYDSAGPVDLQPLPELTARVGGVPRALGQDRPRRVRLALRNPGDAPTGRIRVRARAARGLTVRGAGVVGSLAPGAARTVRLTVTLGRRARALTTLDVTASAGRLRASAQAELRRTTRSAPPSRGGGGGGGSQLCNRWIPDLSGQTGGSLILVPC